ncbi:MAG: SdrD B-like domain-containing protein, partial [Bacteroidota bacterium]
RGGGEILRVQYQGPGISKQDIPDGLLYQQAVAELDIQWTGPNGFSSPLPNPPALEQGVYTLAITDQITQCIGYDTAWVRNGCGTILGKSFLDLNGNGQLDQGEMGQDSIRIILATGAGLRLDTVWTDTSGTYQFGGLLPDTYQLQFANLPDNMSFTAANQGGIEETDSDVGEDGLTAVFLVAKGDSVRGLNAGIIDNASFPVEWSDFRVRQMGQDVILDWSTLQEINHDFFVVERSIDGRLFQPLGKVLPEANQQYQFDDQKAVLLSQAQLFYRIKQVDVDGSFSYSPTLSLDLSQNPDDFLLEVWPNPTDGISTLLRLRGHLQTDWFQLRLLDVHGKIIWEETKILSISPFEMRLPMESLAEGVYVLVVESAKVRKSIRVVKS